MNDDSTRVEETAQQQLMEHDSGRLMIHALSYLDVVTLLQRRLVSKQFKDLCTKAITAKCGKDGPKPHTNETLREALSFFRRNLWSINFHVGDIEKIACTWGFPIDSWNVSQVTDMSELFGGDNFFDEYIGSWDTSNVISMRSMFENAICFNQDISSWDVSNVTDMSRMFH
ncbi:fibronectin domain containing protein [Nitzschia inconspicua]|uniref:Fibronectin domain containing protein n=1 Tax=Nitzschia inconspicua TaxID=303405 RepID=A0A9K3KD82_9STRA|nr:fibronectin domain containing protein [Nitzschia inconspicua]